MTNSYPARPPTRAEPCAARDDDADGPPSGVIGRIMAWSTRHHGLVLLSALLAVLFAELARRSLAGDVVPDLSDPQVVLVADWMGHPATEVAAKVTTVLASALEGVPGSTAIRGSSMAGMAYVDVVFGSPSDLGAGRRTIVERVAKARATLPANVRVQVGPAASSTGWVFQYALFDPSHGQTPLTLRRLQDDVVGPALAAIPGVAEVAPVGGAVEEVLVEVQGDELGARALAFSDVVSALRSSLQAPRSMTPEALRALPIEVPGAAGAPPRIGEVARVRVAAAMPAGLADFGGVSSAVGGVVIARPDARLSSLVENIERTLERTRSRLPPSVSLVTVYDRRDLASRVGRTLTRALGEEILVVVLVILAFLLHGRSALVPLTTLPVVVLLTFAAMWILRVPATIMSVGGIAIALGLAVDADLVALEACHRTLETRGAAASDADRRARIVAAARSFAPAILTSLVITALSFLPVFALDGETGRLLRPLALTKTLVVASAALVTLTLAPALRERLLRGRITPEFDNPITRNLVRVYRPFVQFALTRPALTLGTAALAVASCLPIMFRLGGEFLPRVEEGDLLFMPITLPGVSAHEAAAALRRQDLAIARSKEIATVFGKVGRADTATDPAPFSMAETTVRLLPRSEWPRHPRERWYSGWAPPFLARLLGLVWPEETPLTTAELVEKLDHAARLPGWTSAWTAPARARMDMMTTGVRTPVGIRVVAADHGRLDALGTALRAMALRVPGARSAVLESLGGESWPDFVADPGALARRGVSPALVQETADLVITGGQIGELERDGRRLRVRASLEPYLLGPADRLRAVTVRGAGGTSGQPVPLALLGRPTFVTRPSAVRTERGELVSNVYVDLLEGTDPSGYVERAKRELERLEVTRELSLRPGERIDWTGQYELLAAGERRLRWIVPIIALTMLGLLFLQFRNVVEAAIVLISVPFALVGSFWTLFLLGYPWSAPVWVGLLSVVGLAMQTGVVMVVYIDEAFHRSVREGRLRTREDIVAAHAEGTVLRLRPKIMTITTMAAGLLPLLWAQGAGAEIMCRVAAPMIGGLATSAFLTLEVLPVLYTIWRYRQLRRARRLGVGIEAIVGSAPSWLRR